MTHYQERNNSTHPDSTHPNSTHPNSTALHRPGGLSAAGSQATQSSRDPIAIVGIGCRFPGGADNPDAFWDNLRNGIDAIQEPPASRWNMDRFYDPATGKPGKSYARWGGFVENIDRFDAQFFGISPREASNMDPQHRLLLEVAWEAMEDAGQRPEQMPDQSGVFIGISGRDYGDIQAAISERNALNAYSLLGSTLSIAANRLSYTFDLKGPSMIVDTACSSSLVALHLACQSIWNGESQAALAGGVNIIIRPEGMIGFSKASMLSPDGRCKAFDARANGFVRAEGAGVVLLKPYTQAVADGDSIYATILSTVVNQDGRTNGITVPGGAAQEAMLMAAYKQAGVAPGQVHYVEAHGTGTAVGDPIEANALGQVLSRNRPLSHPCVIGSVKSNIGHLEPASGMAGLIKAALAVKHGQIPANLHFETPNPEIPFDKLQLRVPQQLEAWPADGKRRIAGVNSFGFGGTNAHVVLADAPIHLPTSSVHSTPPGYPLGASPVWGRLGGGKIPNPEQATMTGDTKPTVELLPLSARSPEALELLAAAYRDFLRTGSDNALRDICYSAGVRRAHHSHRLAIMGDSKEALAENLVAYLQREGEDDPAAAAASIVSGRPLPDTPSVAFVFSGMGPQWWAMGRELLVQEPRFRAVIERCDALLRQHADWSLLAELTATEEQSRIQQTEIAQPAIFAIQVALATLWQTWGVEPAFVVGHSVGEVAAAHVAGVLSLEDAVSVIFQRSRLQGTTAGQGRMLAVGLSETAAEQVVADHADQISLAAINSATSITLAGDAQVLATIEQQLTGAGIFARFLQVDVPYHSPAMDAIQPELIAALKQIDPQPATTPLFSTVTGAAIDGTTLDGHYWAQNVRNPVRFAKAVDGLHAAGVDLFLEIGPHPVLGTALRESLAQRNAEPGIVLASLRRKQPERATMLATVGRLYTLGYPVDWSQLYSPDEPTDRSERPPHFVRLPTYPWQREHFWLESAESMQARVGPAAHPLLGERLQSVHAVWNAQLSTQLLPYLQDHAIRNTPTFPAAAYIEMALAAAKEHGAGATTVADLEFQKPFFLDATPVPVQLTFEADQKRFTIYSQTSREWVPYAEGSLRTPAQRVQATNNAARENLDQIRVRCSQQLSGHDCYQRFAAVGLDYGPAFQGITQLWCGDGEVLGALQVPAEISHELAHYQLHPALLDAAFQAIIGLVHESTAMHLPAQIDSVQLHHTTTDLAPDATLWSHVRLVEQRPNAITVDIQLLDDAGRVLATFAGFRCQAVKGTQQTAGERTDSLLYQYGWEVNRPSQPWELADHMRAPQQIATTLHQETIRLSQVAERTCYYTELEPKWDALYHCYVANALYELGWQPVVGQRFSALSLAEELEIIPAQRQLLTRMLELWETDGILRPVQEQPVQEQLVQEQLVQERPVPEHPPEDQPTHQPRQWELCIIPERGNPAPLWQRVMQEHPLHLAEQLLMQRCGTNLAAVLCGTQDPLQLIFPDASFDMAEHLYQDSANARFYNLLVQKAVTQVIEQLPADRTIRILEIGAGTGGLTSYLLPKLPAARTEYHFTDISPQFIAQAQAKFRAYPFVHYQTLDIEENWAEQGLDPHSFNLILASNVLHATCDLRQSLGTVQELLASNGLLLVLEMTRDLRANLLVWGLLDGWWRFTDGDVRPSQPVISHRTWATLLSEVGFTASATLADLDATADPLQSVIIAQGPTIPQEIQPLPKAETPGQWLIFADRAGIGQAVAAQLLAQGGEPILVEQGASYRAFAENHYRICPEVATDWEQLFNQIETPVGVIYLWSTEIPQLVTTSGAPAELPLAAFGHRPVMRLVQTLAQRTAGTPPRLWLVTQGSQIVAGTPTTEASTRPLMAAPAWTLGRVIINEHPYLHCKMVDLSPEISPAEIHALVAELSNHDAEDEIALRGTTRYVHRLQRRTLNGLSERGLPGSPPERLPEPQPFYLEVTTPGILDDLTFRALSRHQPGPGEVEIAVQATALNFKDVAKAMGLLGDASMDGTASGRAVGLECAGTISALGEGVADLQVGDAVIAFANNSFSTHAYADARSVMPKPAGLRFEEAATIPLVFVTAHYALHHLGRIQQGERILIHAAAGGVGLAAIQIAQAAGAEIFATAGTPQKRDFLQALGIPATHVMDSRALDFAEQIMAVTNGEGVDLVLNSLTGEALEASLAALAPFGRFLELGKRDIEQNHKLGLRPFQQNLAFFAIDLDRLTRERPKMANALFQEVMARVADGVYRPLPLRIFSIAHVVDAFRYMAQAKHIGKVVVALAEPDVKVAAAATEADTAAAAAAVRFRGDGTYLITGGLGGFGLAVAEWMVAHGARHLRLLGRSGVKTDAQRLAIQAMAAAGATVDVIQADVTEATAVNYALAQIPPETPLRGIIHAAMVLDDSLLVNLTPERFDRVMAPKVLGAWHLHQQTLQLPLDFFVLFSSASAAVGNPGQGSYVAANAFLEALADYRRGQNLPALTVSWGAIGGVGYVANNQEVTEHLNRIGFGALPHTQALTLLGEFLHRDLAQVTVGQVDWQQWAAFNHAGVLPRFSQLIATELDSQQDEQQQRFLQRLAETPAGERRRYLYEHLRGQVAKVLGISKPEQIEPQQPFFDLGLDSLMGVELKNRLEKSLERSLPQMLLFDHPNLAALVEHLVTDLLASTIHFAECELERAPEGTPQVQAAGPVETAGVAAMRPAARNPVTANGNGEHIERLIGHGRGQGTPGTVAPETTGKIDLDAEVLLDSTIRFEPTTVHDHAEPRAVLLTGATGFLGAFLLHELGKQTNAQIYCLVRAKSAQQGLARIQKNLTRYALWDDAFVERIVPVLGDLARPLLGLSSEHFARLAEEIDRIYHNGAWVNFMASYADLNAANVLGTQEILRLAGQDHTKPLHFISSYSVFFSQERTQAETIREHDELSPAATLCDNGYVQSKWVAEKLVRLAQARGLPVAIYRPGVLSGDSRTGIANPTDLANRMILGCVQLGYVPAENTLMDLCPVDYAGAAIVHLSQQPATYGNAFHLVNPDPLLWHEWVAWLNDLGYPLQTVPYDAWKAKLQLALANQTTQNALLPFIEALPRSKGDTERFLLTQVYLEGKAPRFDCQNTLDGLADSAIAYPAVDVDLLRRYFAYFIEQGALQAVDTNRFSQTVVR